MSYVDCFARHTSHGQIAGNRQGTFIGEKAKSKSMSNDENEPVFEVVHSWALTACQSSPDCFRPTSVV